jgi:hypothetical protein
MIQIPTFNPGSADWESKITLGTQEILIRFDVPHAQVDALVGTVTHSGDTFGGEFTTKGKCVVWTGPGDTYRKAP